MNNNSDTVIPGDKKDLSSIFKKYIVPCILLVILTLIVSWIAYQRVQIQIIMGPGWDTYAFLANALEFAGKSIGYAEFDRPPFMSFITSFFFRSGNIHESTIFYVDGGFFVLGVIGLYLFLKLRFDSIQSFTGALLFASSPVVLSWLGVGYTDLASVALSIWALYFLVLSVEKSPWFYYLAFPVAMMAFLTRYTAGLILFPMILYIVISRKYLSHFKKMIGGIIAAFMVLLPFLVYNYQNLGDPIGPFLGFLSASESAGLESIAYDPNPKYYLTNLPSYIATQGDFSSILVYLIFLIVIVGIIIYFYDLIREKLMKSRVKGKVSKILEIQRTGTKIKLVFFTGLLLIFLITFNRVSYMTSELVFLLLSYASFTLLKDITSKKIEIDLLFLAWFMTYFIFHSVFVAKVDRYFVTMAPAFSYFVILGLSEIVNKLQIKIKGTNLTAWVISLFLIFLALSSAVSFLNEMPQKEDYIVRDSKIASAWFANYDLDYHSKLIYSDAWPTVSWYLGADVKPMPVFKDSRAFNHELQKYDVDYYFTLYGNRNLTAYDQIAKFGTVSIFKKNPEKFDNKPQMLYIGKNWQNYLDDVLGFNAYVINGRSNEYGAKIYDLKFRNQDLFLDDYQLEEIKKYDSLSLYNFAWHNQSKAENLILDYAESGGTVVIDLSANLDGIYYGLDNAIFLDTLITRKVMNENPRIEINPQINQTADFSPFKSEDGGVWVGANYESFGENKIENLVTANGKTLIGIQKVGKGKIIWIGYNLIWHSFVYENTYEKQLIQDIIFKW
ncbi:MAG: glycosyltransferase family 39 protein [Euryarchaeota archaeon]